MDRDVHPASTSKAPLPEKLPDLAGETAKVAKEMKDVHKKPEEGRNKD